MGVLGWTPQQQGYFQSFHNLVGALSQGFFIQPMLRRLGTRRAYEYGERSARREQFLISRAQRVSAETVSCGRRAGFNRVLRNPGAVRAGGGADPNVR